MKKKKGKIVSYTAEEILQGKAGKSRTDWEKVDALSDEDIEKAIDGDVDAAPRLDSEWFEKAEWAKLYEEPQDKERITINLDKDIVDFFKQDGRGYQTRINSALKAFVRAKKHKNQPERRT